MGTTRHDFNLGTDGRALHLNMAAPEKAHVVKVACYAGSLLGLQVSFCFMDY